MGIVRTTYLIDEQGIIIKANDKVKAADDPENMLKELPVTQLRLREPGVDVQLRGGKVGDLMNDRHGKAPLK